jgi:hypothetical protein
MKTTRNNRTANAREIATTEAEFLVIEIAERQRQIAAIVAAAQKQVEALAVANADAERKLENLITRRNANAKPIAGAIRRHQVRTGDMSSRLVEAIEKRGQQIFPAAKQISMPWCIVSNNF